VEGVWANVMTSRLVVVHVAPHAVSATRVVEAEAEADTAEVAVAVTVVAAAVVDMVEEALNLASTSRRAAALEGVHAASVMKVVAGAVTAVTAVEEVATVVEAGAMEAEMVAVVVVEAEAMEAEMVVVVVATEVAVDTVVATEVVVGTVAAREVAVAADTVEVAAGIEVQPPE